MDDDFNTADAIAAVFELVKYINTTADGTRSKEYLESLFERLRSLTDVLGIIAVSYTHLDVYKRQGRQETWV